MNPFQAIPPAVRKWLYLAYGTVGLVLGGFQVAGQETINGASVIKILAVFAYVGTVLGFTAGSNTPSYRDVVEGDAPPPDTFAAPSSFRDVEFREPPEPRLPDPGRERGAVDVMTVVIVVILVVILLAVLGFLR